VSLERVAREAGQFRPLILARGTASGGSDSVELVHHTSTLDASPAGKGMSHPGCRLRSMDGIDLTGSSTDLLEQELVGREQTVSQLRAEQMMLLTELDRRQVATGDGCKSLSEWVSGRLDVAPETAATLVRTTRRLEGLPATAKRLQAGEMSFDRVVELARLATPEDEHTILDEAWRWDITGLRRHIAARRRLTSVEERAAFTTQHLVMQPNLDQTRWDLWGSLPGVAGAVIDRALQQRAESLPTLPDMKPSRAHRHPVLSTQYSVLSTQYLDPNREDAVRRLPSAVCRLCFEVIVDPGEGMPIAAGPAAHGIPPRLRRFVLARDGGCCADGCTSRYRLQPHHRIRREHGGTDDPSNLVTLCWFHHQIVIHGYGYRIDPESPPGRIRFSRPKRSKDPP
jgi:hypothetical protein